MVLEQMLSGIVPAMKAISTAILLDVSAKIVCKEKSVVEIFFPLSILVILIAYEILTGKTVGLISVKIKNKLRNTYCMEIIDIQAQLKYMYFENAETRDLIYRVCESTEEKLVAAFINVLSLFRILMCVIAMMLIVGAYVCWVAIGILVISIPLCIVSAMGGKQIYNGQRIVSKDKRRLEYLSDLLSNREAALERHLFGYAVGLNDRWMKQYEEVYEIEVNVHKKWFKRMNAGGIFVVFASLFIAAVLIKPVQQGSITEGMFISLIIYLTRLVQMVSWELTRQIDAHMQDREFLHELFSFFQLDLNSGMIDLPANTPLDFKEIEFRNVSFTYPGDEQKILNNISFILERGKRYAFVGVNGAGKTTIVKLLTGLYDEFQGDILIDGRSIKLFSQAEIKALSMVVYQDFSKYEISLRDNILMGDIHKMDSDIGNRKVKEICSQLELDHIISKLPKGVDTYLGKINKEGVDLSGGEWQQIAIARAGISEAPLIIFDEPTASLDPIREGKTHSYLKQLYYKKTLILISHRMAAVRDVDRIFVISGGKVVESGTHDELLERAGIYYEMYDKQRSWYK